MVLEEYESEDRFVARRLTAWAELDGALVEDVTVDAVAEAGVERVLDVGCGTGDFTQRLHREPSVEVGERQRGAVDPIAPSASMTVS